METNIISSVRLPASSRFQLWYFYSRMFFHVAHTRFWVVATLSRFLDYLFILGQQHSAKATLLRLNFNKVSGLYKINVMANP